MNKYEIVFLVNKNITLDERNAVLDIITNCIKSNGDVQKVEEIGLRKLAYEVRKQQEAYYYVVYFETEPSNIQELERLCRINENILKFIVVKQDD